MSIDLAPLLVHPAEVTSARLVVLDVWRLWCEEEAGRGRKPIAVRTVYANIAHSQPAMPGRPPNRYQSNPMPLPCYPHPDRPRAGQQPYWTPAAGEKLAELEQRLRDWWVDRPGRGKRGVKRVFAPRRRPCGCGSGVTVWAGRTCGQCAYALTLREWQVCAEVVAGMAVAEVAERLSLSPLTVKSHLKAAYRKVGVHGRAELVARLVPES